jgi:hypothetical protein
MGKHVNSKFDTSPGRIFLLLIMAAAVVAIPLMIVDACGNAVNLSRRSTVFKKPI